MTKLLLLYRIVIILHNIIWIYCLIANSINVFVEKKNCITTVYTYIHCNILCTAIWNRKKIINIREVNCMFYYSNLNKK